jgi:transcriptional regulator with XRE-family HTH domain
LRELRKALGYNTAKEFADMLDVSPSRYGNVEAGLSLAIELALTIVRMVPGCSLDWLYYGKEDGLSVGLWNRLADARGSSEATVSGR